MIVIVYRSRCSIRRPDGWHAALWSEYRFEPRPSERRESPAGWIHHRSEAVALAIDSGFGRIGADAEALHYLAGRGERHCRLIGEDTEVARRRDDGPSLFGADEPAPATASAYPRAAARPADGPPPREPPGGGAMARSGDAIDRCDRLEAAIRAALPWLEDEGVTPRPLTAANILRAALGPAAGSAQARGA